MEKFNRIINSLIKRRAGNEGSKSKIISAQIRSEQELIRESIAKENQMIVSGGKKVSSDEIQQIIDEFGQMTPLEILRKHTGQIRYISERFTQMLQANLELFSSENKRIRDEMTKINDLGGRVDPLIPESISHYEKEVEPELKKLMKYWSGIKDNKSMMPNEPLSNTKLWMHFNALISKIKILKEANNKILNKP
ncbi:MAG: hypothetical protein ACP5NW_01190 [Candidatus Woesearchaeota archaeon]